MPWRRASCCRARRVSPSASGRTACTGPHARRVRRSSRRSRSTGGRRPAETKLDTQARAGGTSPPASRRRRAARGSRPRRSSVKAALLARPHPEPRQPSSSIERHVVGERPGQRRAASNHAPRGAPPRRRARAARAATASCRRRPAPRDRRARPARPARATARPPPRSRPAGSRRTAAAAATRGRGSAVSCAEEFARAIGRELDGQRAAVAALAGSATSTLTMPNAWPNSSARR